MPDIDSFSHAISDKKIPQGARRYKLNSYLSCSIFLLSAAGSSWMSLLNSPFHATSSSGCQKKRNRKCFKSSLGDLTYTLNFPTGCVRLQGVSWITRFYRLRLNSKLKSLFPVYHAK